MPFAPVTYIPSDHVTEVYAWRRPAIMMWRMHSIPNTMVFGIHTDNRVINHSPYSVDSVRLLPFCMQSACTYIRTHHYVRLSLHSYVRSEKVENISRVSTKAFKQIFI